MLNLTPPNYQFCPFCGRPLSKKADDHRIRKFCPNCNWIYYPHVHASSAAVIVKDNQVLLVKRAREPSKGTWMFPAGFIEYGEHPLDTAKREAKEEVGIEVTSATLIDVFQITDDPREPGHYCFFYLVKTNSTTHSNSDPSENSAIAWHPISHPPIIGWLSHNKVIQMLQRGRVL